MGIMVATAGTLHRVAAAGQCRSGYTRRPRLECGERKPPRALRRRGGLSVKRAYADFFLPSKYSSISSSVLPLVSGMKKAAVTKYTTVEMPQRMKNEA